MNSTRRVVIVGAGFGGLSAARALAGKKGIEVTLLDRRNHHLFQPLLYQVATAGLSPADIAMPIRSIFSRSKNVRVVLAKVDAVDLKAQKVKSGDLTFDYDDLILACGAEQGYFGHPDWEEFAPGLKSLEQATEIRRRMLLAFELAEREWNPELQKELLSIVIVGGGPTGVELAGAIAEISRHTLARDFRHIDPSRTRVILIEAGSRILAGFDEELSRKAARDLEALGVQVWTGTRVTAISGNSVSLGSEVIRARTILWAAGVAPNALSSLLGVPLDRAGRVQVQADLSLPGFPSVFVIGDQAAALGIDGSPLPGLAPVAMQQGRYVASLIREAQVSKNAEPSRHPPFRYVDKGQMATIGRRKAVAEFRKIRFSGFVAWAGWLFVHIFYLIGFKNRLFVFMQWAWSYLTFKRGARLIVDKEWRSVR